MKAGTMIVRSESAVTGAAYESRLQSHPQVLPKGGVAASKDKWDDTWDDRSHREIIWGVAREHTLIGFATAFAYGTGTRLATTPQAVQLLCGSLVGLLFLSCAQLRYMWLGATWAPTWPEYEGGVLGADVMNRLSFLSYVSFAGALVGWMGMFATRFLFYLANQTAIPATRRMSALIYCGAWFGILLLCGALTLGSLSMASNIDAPVVQNDVIVSWILAFFVQVLLCEPLALLWYLGITLLLKWCTSFEDLPENKAETVKKQKEIQIQRKAQLQAEKPPPVAPSPPLQIAAKKAFKS